MATRDEPRDGRIFRILLSELMTNFSSFGRIELWISSTGWIISRSRANPWFAVYIKPVAKPTLIAIYDSNLVERNTVFFSGPNSNDITLDVLSVLLLSECKKGETPV